MISAATQCAAPITGTSGASRNRRGNGVCAINVSRVRGSNEKQNTAPEELMSVLATAPFHHSPGSCTRSESTAPNVRGNRAKCARPTASSKRT